MKKFICVACVILVLCGCSRVDYETIGDTLIDPPPQPVGEMVLTLPEDGKLLSYDGQKKLYCCNGYEITLEILPGGDINETLHTLTGYPFPELTVLQTGVSGLERYDCSWISAGENGDQVGRTAIISDGNYHYAVCLTSDAREAGSLQETWQALLSSFAVHS